MITKYCGKFPIISFAAGLFASQIISFFHIYHSNINLSETIHNLKKTGYLVVPDGQVLLSLNNFFPAFKAALFFTATAGILITFISIASFIILSKTRLFSKIYLRVYISLWGGATLYLILQNQSIITCTFTSIIPFVAYLTLENSNPNHLMARCDSKEKKGLISIFAIIGKGKPPWLPAEGYPLPPTMVDVRTNSDKDNAFKKKDSKEKITREFIILILAISISASLFYIKADKTLFLRVRDYLLLDSTAGKTINNFYYKYTLFAAEAVKAPLQKQIKSCWLHPDIGKINELTKALSQYGWLKIDDKSLAGFVVDPVNDETASGQKKNTNTYCSPSPWDKNCIVFKKNTGILHITPKTLYNFLKNLTGNRADWPGKGKATNEGCQNINTIISNKSISMEAVNIDVFLENPLYYLKLYSQFADNHKFLRRFCALGLVMGLPVLFFCMIFFVFVLFFNFISCVFKFCMNKRYSAFLSGAATVFLSALLIFYVYPAGFNPGRKGQALDSENQKIKTMLNSHSNRIRVEGLRQICRIKTDSIGQYTEIFDMLKNGSDAEKYWLANVLGLSKNVKNMPILKALAQDSSINVQCAAIKAMMELKGSIPRRFHNDLSIFFKKILIQSKSWYVQRSAYKGIKRFSDKFNTL